jgi:hypothetical protein
MYPKVPLHQPPDGEQCGDSPRRSSPKGDPLGGPPFNPLVGSYVWPTFDPRMFIPPWYQPLVVQIVPELIIYHIGSYNIQLMSKTLIMMFTTKCSRRPSKLMVKQWKLTSLSYLILLSKIISLNGDKTLFKTIQIALLKN